MRNEEVPTKLKVMHVDDEEHDLAEFSEFIEQFGKGDFSLSGFKDVSLALSYLARTNDVALCIVDLELSQRDEFKFNEKEWDGFAFVTIGKILSPSTNFMVLSSRVGPQTTIEAAKAGCFGILRKRWIVPEKATQVIEQIGFACQYSQYFLKFKSDARLNFSNSIAHSLKTVLRKWRIELDELKRRIERMHLSKKVDYPRLSEMEARVTALDGSIESVTRRLQRVLEFYTLQELCPERVNLGAFLNNLSQSFASFISFSNLSDAEAIDCLFDPLLVRQAIENIFDNAFKAVDHRKEDPLIEFSWALEVADCGAEYLRFSVLDNGIGLEDGEDERAIEPNYSGKNMASRAVSFGVGCTEAEKIARMHWNNELTGSYRIKNRSDSKGCEAVLILPRFASMLEE